MSSAPATERRPGAVVFGCAGPTLTEAERRFFAEADPLGFILFARNCETPDQVRALSWSLREAVGRADAPILIDQEGGRVARMGPPNWRASPAAGRFAALADRRPPEALEAARLNARLMAEDLRLAGVTVDCAPVLDVPAPGADPIIGDRAHGFDPCTVRRLGTAVCEGLLAGHVTPIIKHIPGHGRATVDSHKALPMVEAAPMALAGHDLPPFVVAAETFGRAVWAMTAHVTYAAYDPDHPATTSRTVIENLIRGTIDFKGLLISDDIEMSALSGTLAERAAASIAAGCDLVLHCNGTIAEFEAVAAAVPPMTEAAWGRFLASEEARTRTPLDPIDRDWAEARIADLLSEGAR